MSLHNRFVIRSLTRLAGAAALVLSLHAAALPPNDPPDLGSTPPDLSQSVDPNIMVTFDDSGSMQSNFMGDDRPFDTNDWGRTDPINNPWFCAGVINPSITTAGDVRLDAMNGVYYNPNVLYSPPLYQNGTPFPVADATLANVANDGVALNRPRNSITTTTAAYRNNPNSNANASDTNATILNGAYASVNIAGRSTGSRAVCPSSSTYDTISSCNCTNPGRSSNVCTWNDARMEDARWVCGATTGSPTTGPNSEYPSAWFDGSSSTSGGPYYYRYIGPTIAVDTHNNPTAAGITNIYTVGNWEAVPVTNTNVTINGTTVNQWQNFANWFSYYRTRNIMTRSALSRVFGVLGSNLRVGYQNLLTSGFTLPSGSIINNLSNTGTCVDANVDPSVEETNLTTTCYRSAFFNWIFSTAGNFNTPARAAMIRAGEVFKRTATNLTSPYWDPTSSHELGCRQNFSMLVTDGFWNETNPTTPSGFFDAHTGPAGGILPDGAAYSTTDLQSKIYWNYPTNTTGACSGDGSTDCYPAQADIAFYYWASDLRSDLAPGSSSTSATIFKDAVPSYVKDLTTGVVPTATVVTGSSNLNEEVYYNPNNDPATWRHVDEFMVTLGAFGALNYSTDTNCTGANDSTGVNDACDLRKGVINSTGAVGWPIAERDVTQAIDDTWHGAVNSRGAFFPATNPANLIQHLADILDSISARSGQSAAESVSTSILTTGAVGYQGGYNSAGWSGYLYKQTLDPTTGAANPVPAWDAGCILTGGLCAATGINLGTAPDPTQRKIFTATGASANALSGAPFEWASLSGNDQALLNMDPTTTFPNTATTLTPTTNGTADDNGQYRVAYLHGTRTYETQATPSTTNPIEFRSRTSLLGAIVGSQAVYEGGPAGGFLDIYPIGSPEQVAAAPCASGTTATGCNSYEKFVSANLHRNAAVYVGANDGMLHSFNASTGNENWAFVPHALYSNGQLNQLTNPNNGLVVSVDDTPIIQDVFVNSTWKTMLIGTTRLGGRSVFALDVTDSTAATSETAAAGKFMWEFDSDKTTSTNDLGYTYASQNVARIRCNVAPCSGVTTTTAPTGGTWVVLVASGYFPHCIPPSGSTCQVNAHSATDTAPGASAVQSYLWVLNAADGSVIAKLATPSSVTSYGMSTPTVVDFGLDQIDDIAVAGDLAGNLWRFDLSDPNPANWKVDNIFQTYTNTNACSTSNVQGIGCEPITVMPVAFSDVTTGSVIYVFGSGQYLGQSDRTSTSVLTPQHFFGVRDYGAGYTAYPFKEANLSTQTLTQDASGNRSLTYAATAPTTAPSRGWQIALNLTAEPGERDVTTAIPIFSSGTAILVSLIPSNIVDPCVSARFGAIMAINADTGGPALAQTNAQTTGVVGQIVTNPPALGGAGAIDVLGGGKIILPGIVAGAGGAAGGAPPTLSGLVPVWRRTSWNEVINNL